MNNVEHNGREFSLTLGDFALGTDPSLLLRMTTWRYPLTGYGVTKWKMDANREGSVAGLRMSWLGEILRWPLS
jgi:hypothetical protein